MTGLILLGVVVAFASIWYVCIIFTEQPVKQKLTQPMHWLLTINTCFVVGLILYFVLMRKSGLGYIFFEILLVLGVIWILTNTTWKILMPAAAPSIWGPVSRKAITVSTCSTHHPRPGPWPAPRTGMRRDSSHTDPIRAIGSWCSGLERWFCTDRSSRPRRRACTSQAVRPGISCSASEDGTKSMALTVCRKGGLAA